MRLLLALVLLASAPALTAQDARYNHLHATPQLINPALIGVMDGSLRFTANYQKLYASVLGPEAYRGVAAGAEVRGITGGDNFFGLGLQLQRDEAGDSDFERSQGYLGGSYQQRIAGGGRGRNRSVHYLSIGGQFGFGQRGIDLNKLWFSNQYFVDPVTRDSYIDRNRPTGEPIAGSGGTVYMDMNAGVAWFARLGERRGAYFGLSGYHLNTPNLSPVPDATDFLDRRYTLYGGGELPLGRGYSSLLPALRVNVQGAARSALVGSNFRYTQRNWREIAMRLGLWLQLSNRLEGGFGPNSAVAAFGLETERLQFGFSYDINVGPLTAVTNSRGGFELSVIYLRPPRRRDRVVCPTF